MCQLIHLRYEIAERGEKKRSGVSNIIVFLIFCKKCFFFHIQSFQATSLIENGFSEGSKTANERYLLTVFRNKIRSFIFFLYVARIQYLDCLFRERKRVYILILLRMNRNTRILRDIRNALFRNFENLRKLPDMISILHNGAQIH